MKTTGTPELITAAWADRHAPPGYLASKRTLDVLISALVLVVLLPLWLLIALLIKFSSPGPVFYRGTVIGKGGRAFRYYKFRTMPRRQRQPGAQGVAGEVRQGRHGVFAGCLRQAGFQGRQ